ncbi:MAG: alpha/beta fold hydrolase [Dehalococcoidia bacterium]
MDDRDRAARRTKRYAGYLIESALDAERQRVAPLNPLKWPVYSPANAPKKLLLIPGLGTNSEDTTLHPFAKTLPAYAPCEFSYSGFDHPVFSESDSTHRALANIRAAVRLLDDYLVFDGSTRVIVAHSFGGVLAYEWIWQNRRMLNEASPALSLYLVASPVFVAIPHTSAELEWKDDSGRQVVAVVEGLTYPPDRVARGITQITACFCEGDNLALPPVCALPERPHTENIRLSHAEHPRTCHSAMCDFAQPNDALRKLAP